MHRAEVVGQRVQLLSAASTEPWIRLLCYDTSKVPRLCEVAQDGSLEPHPVSGQVEVDWIMIPKRGTVGWTRRLFRLSWC